MIQKSKKKMGLNIFKVQKKPSSQLFLVAFAIMWGIVVFPHVAVGKDTKSGHDPVSSIAQSDFFSGVVTGVAEKKVAINNKGYGLHKNVTVQDDEGALLDLEDLVEGIEVRFHLDKGKIDQLVLMLPR